MTIEELRNYINIKTRALNEELKSIDRRTTRASNIKGQLDAYKDIHKATFSKPYKEEKKTIEIEGCTSLVPICQGSYQAPIIEYVSQKKVVSVYVSVEEGLKRVGIIEANIGNSMIFFRGDIEKYNEPSKIVKLYPHLMYLNSEVGIYLNDEVCEGYIRLK